MSYARRARALGLAVSTAQARNLNPRGWGEVEVGDWVTTFGRHGAGQPAIDGAIISIEKGEVIIRTKNDGDRRRSISSVRKPGR